MAIIWPEALVSELAERRCIIFMGAGASMGSLALDGLRKPPGWRALLEGLLPRIPNNKDKALVSRLLKKQRFLDAAEIIRDACNAADFTQYLETTFTEPHFQPSEYHKVIRDIDPKIVMTTNYDQIYDQYCIGGAAAAGYKVSRYHDPTLVQNLRSRQSLVVKAHGCLSQPENIILSRSSYYRAKRDYSGFYSVLDALFLTQTILFVGCSLTDPDIQLVLENANISASSSHPHYALVENVGHYSTRKAIKEMHNIELLEYKPNRYDLAVAGLVDLKDQVLTKRSLSEHDLTGGFQV
jgi:hypothetical protein